MDKILLIVRTYPHIFPSHIENQAAWVNRCKVAYQHFIYDREYDTCIITR